MRRPEEEGIAVFCDDQIDQSGFVEACQFGLSLTGCLCKKLVYEAHRFQTLYSPYTSGNQTTGSSVETV